MAAKRDKFTFQGLTHGCKAGQKVVVRGESVVRGECSTRIRLLSSKEEEYHHLNLLSCAQDGIRDE